VQLALRELKWRKREDTLDGVSVIAVTLYLFPIGKGNQCVEYLEARTPIPPHVRGENEFPTLPGCGLMI
jgi:hypothetical protein